MLLDPCDSSITITDSIYRWPIVITDSRFEEYLVEALF